MRVCDYVADFLYRNGINDVFLVTGGGAMFLNDGIVSHDKLNFVCNHHEQASAMAGVGYAKMNNHPGAVLPTTGCGSTNAITGLLDAWQDNVPLIFISGQVKSKETVRNASTPLRQFGVQEADIIAIVSSITKYAVMINDPNEIGYHLQKAAYLATSGRPGPVWIDIPMDVQGAVIDPAAVKAFDPDECADEYGIADNTAEIEQLKELIRQAERPVIIAGNGIRLSGSADRFRQFVEENAIPSVATYLGVDLLPTDHELNIGRIGIKGDRAGNFAMQNADLVVSLGSRLAVPSTGFEYELFAREAKVVVVDIDPKEHRKNTVKIDLFIHADLKRFFTDFGEAVTKERTSWLEKCRHWKKSWPVCQPQYEQEPEGINLYYFIDKLCEASSPSDVFVSDAGSSYYVSSQSIRIKDKQRYITSGAQADMGFGLPAAIGVSAADRNRNVLAITGDGSFQMNIQELQTVAHYQLNIKLFVWNNNGYLSIRATQSKFFEGRAIGTDRDSGVSFPETRKIADAYGIRYFGATSSKELTEVIEEVLAIKGPVICEIFSPPNQEIVPNVSSLKKPDGTLVSKPLEDMYPFLDREEFFREMIVKPIDE